MICIRFFASISYLITPSQSSLSKSRPYHSGLFHPVHCVGVISQQNRNVTVITCFFKKKSVIIFHCILAFLHFGARACLLFWLLLPLPLSSPGLCPLNLSLNSPFWEQALYGSHRHIFTHAASSTGNDLLYQSQLIFHFSSTWSPSKCRGEEYGSWSPTSCFGIQALPLKNDLGNFLKLSVLRFSLL